MAETTHHRRSPPRPPSPPSLSDETSALPPSIPPSPLASPLYQLSHDTYKQLPVHLVVGYPQIVDLGRVQDRDVPDFVTEGDVVGGGADEGEDYKDDGREEDVAEVVEGLVSSGYAFGSL